MGRRQRGGTLQPSAESPKQRERSLCEVCSNVSSEPLFGVEDEDALDLVAADS